MRAPAMFAEPKMKSLRFLFTEQIRLRKRFGSGVGNVTCDARRIQRRHGEVVSAWRKAADDVAGDSISGYGYRPRQVRGTCAVVDTVANHIRKRRAISVKQRHATMTRLPSR